MGSGINNITFNAKPAPEIRQDKKNNRLSTLAMDLGLGAVAGGLIGYTSKPWQVNGQLTDEFIGSVMEDLIDLKIKKEPESKELWEVAKTLLKLDVKNGLSEEAMLEVLEKNADVLNLENVKNPLLRDNLKEEMKNIEGFNDIIEAFSEKMNKLKESIVANFSDIKKGELKPLGEKSVTAKTDAYNILENKIKSIKKGSAIRWAIVGSLAMAVGGFLTDLIMNKVNSKKVPTMHTYRS